MKKDKMLTHKEMLKYIGYPKVNKHEFKAMKYLKESADIFNAIVNYEGVKHGKNQRQHK